VRRERERGEKGERDRKRRYIYRERDREERQRRIKREEKKRREREKQETESIHNVLAQLNEHISRAHANAISRTMNLHGLEKLRTSWGGESWFESWVKDQLLLSTISTTHTYISLYI